MIKVVIIDVPMIAVDTVNLVLVAVIVDVSAVAVDIVKVVLVVAVVIVRSSSSWWRSCRRFSNIKQK